MYTHLKVRIISGLTPYIEQVSVTILFKKANTECILELTLGELPWQSNFLTV